MVCLDQKMNRFLSLCLLEQQLIPVRNKPLFKTSDKGLGMMKCYNGVILWVCSTPTL